MNPFLPNLFWAEKIRHGSPEYWDIQDEYRENKTFDYAWFGSQKL